MRRPLFSPFAEDSTLNHGKTPPQRNASTELMSAWCQTRTRPLACNVRFRPVQTLTASQQGYSSHYQLWHSVDRPFIGAVILIRHLDAWPRSLRED